MFLDPDPKRQKQSGSGFFASQRPIISPRTSGAAWRRKNLSPLEEISQPDNNQQNPGTNPLRPTVRLVKPLPEESRTDETEDDGGFADDTKENIEAWQNLEQLPSSPTNIIEGGVIKPSSPRSADSDQGFDVSDTHQPANEAQRTSRFSHDNLLSSTSSYAIPRSEWDYRSESSGDYSNTSTFIEGGSGYEQKSFWSESRISDGSTLRLTPTPTEFEHRKRISGEDTSRQTSGQKLETVAEASPERSTVRLVGTPPGSSSSNDQSPPEPLNTSKARAQTLPSDSDGEATSSERSSRRTSSGGSLPAPHNIPNLPSSPTSRHRRSQEFVAQSQTFVSVASSPNLVTFGSDPSRPRPSSQPLHAVSSAESIQSRLDGSTAVRPATGQSGASSTSWSSKAPNSDNLPPLYIPKKRVRHKPGYTALKTAKERSAAEPTMEDEDVDTQPYPRQPFSMHLSTIASESDPQSRTASQHLSHFSLGSGVLTVDDSGSVPPSATWPPHRSEGAYNDYPASDVSPVSPERNSSEEPGDMTMGVFRQESALPEPLFQARSSSAPRVQRKYEGPQPPLPPIPKSRESDEYFDVVPDLARPSLHERRSGYSLRRNKSRSSASRSHSRQVSQATESSRWSQGSNIFPTWAKAYYAYGATLLSSSQISLYAPEEVHGYQNLRQYRFNRDWGTPSISTSFGSSSVTSPSPASSHFLPNIFRPRAKRERSGNSKKTKGKGKKKASPREANSRPDSMVITQDPGPSGQQDVISSSEPRYGNLEDGSGHPPLARKYTKQKKWDQMQFPRPMSKDILGAEEVQPHLGPSKRTGKGVSVWHAPSFTESLNTLFRSRCNRQILFFVLGFICPLFWIVGAVLPLPNKPMSAEDFEKAQTIGGSEEDVQTAMMRLEAGDAEKRWNEERQWMKARWWRYLNRIMSVIGVLVIGAVIALAIVATTK